MFVKYVKILFMFVIVVVVGMVLFVVGIVYVDIKMLYIGMNGGNMECIYIQFVFLLFEKVNNVKVVVVFGILIDIFVKVQVIKGCVQMYVMMLDDGVMFCVIGMGLCEKFKFLVNLLIVLVIVYFKGDYVVGLLMGLMGLVYSIKIFVDKGWMLFILWGDLVDLKYKGKVVV